MVAPNGLSLLITCFNSEEQWPAFLKWLYAHIESFSEIILVDDCSQDSTPELLGELARSDNRVKLILRDENSGRPSIPRNQAVEKASYSRIVFMDVDDLLPSVYVGFLQEHARNGNKDIFSGTKLAVEVSGFKSDYPCDLNLRREISPFGLRFKNQMVLSGSSLPSSLAKKYSFDSRPLEDWLYWREISLSNCRGQIIRLLDVPIAYNCEISLSPKKGRQVRRVNKHLPIFGLVAYALILVRMKIEESRLKSKYYSV